VIDGAPCGVVIYGDCNGSVVSYERTVTPDDRSARSSLQDHVIAVVACKVELEDWLRCSTQAAETITSWQAPAAVGYTVHSTCTVRRSRTCGLHVT